MRVLLVQPPFSRLKEHRHSSEFQPYVGLGYLAEVLLQKGYETYYYNADDNSKERYSTTLDLMTLRKTHYKYLQALKNDNHHVWWEYKKLLSSFCPDVVGFSVKSPLVPAALKLSGISKKILPTCKVVWGNTHPTVLPEEVLSYSCVDFVIRGEGEETFCELLPAIEQKKDIINTCILGVSTKIDGKIVHYPDRPFIQDLDTIPFPTKHLLKSARWKMPIITARGCSGRCKFCADRGIWKNKVRFRSIENVISELEKITKVYGIREINFCDPTFNLQNLRVLELCEAIREYKLNFIWDCLVRLDNLDNEMLKAMYSTGCKSVIFGVETGSKHLLKETNKDFSIEQIISTISLIKKNHILMTALFVVGLPSEEAEDLKSNSALIEIIKTHRVFISNFTPQPGSQYFDEFFKGKNLLQNYHWEKLSFYTPIDFVTSNKSESYKKALFDFITKVDTINAKNKILLSFFKKSMYIYIKYPLQLYRTLLRLIGK